MDETAGWHDAPNVLGSNWLALVGYEELMGTSQTFTFRKAKRPFRASNSGAEAPRRQTRYTDPIAKKLYAFRDSWALDHAVLSDDSVFLFERTILRAGTDGWVSCRQFDSANATKRAWGEILALSEDLALEETELLAVR